jgi:hypothetical protein
VSDQPWDFATARQACRDASQAQHAAEDALTQAYRDYAAAEENYRVALAKQIVSEHDADRSWSVAPDLARGCPDVAALRHKRDVAEGVMDAMHAGRLAPGRRPQGRAALRRLVPAPRVRGGIRADRRARGGSHRLGCEGSGMTTTLTDRQETVLSLLAKNGPMKVAEIAKESPRPSPTPRGGRPRNHDR